MEPQPLVGHWQKVLPPPQRQVSRSFGDCNRTLEQQKQAVNSRAEGGASCRLIVNAPARSAVMRDTPAQTNGSADPDAQAWTFGRKTGCYRFTARLRRAMSAHSTMTASTPATIRIKVTLSISVHIEDLAASSCKKKRPVYRIADRTPTVSRVSLSLQPLPGGGRHSNNEGHGRCGQFPNHAIRSRQDNPTEVVPVIPGAN